jgi:hypothetical protein
MKKIMTYLFFTATIFTVTAQESNQKIIFDVTSTDNKVYQSVLVTLKIMSASSPSTKFEVIAYGEAVPMLMKNQSIVAGEIAKYIENDNVLFTACEISMGLFNIKKEQLLKGVGTVGNAVEEIVKKQGLGWGYIKSGN